MVDPNFGQSNLAIKLGFILLAIGLQHACICAWHSREVGKSQLKSLSQRFRNPKFTTFSTWQFFWYRSFTIREHGPARSNSIFQQPTWHLAPRDGQWTWMSPHQQSGRWQEGPPKKIPKRWLNCSTDWQLHIRKSKRASASPSFLPRFPWWHHQGCLQTSPKLRTFWSWNPLPPPRSCCRKPAGDTGWLKYLYTSI